MADDVSQVPIRILDKEYVVACQPSEREALLASAQLLDARMREIRDTGKVIGTERIAVMAALNMAHDLLQEQQKGNGYTEAVNARLRTLQNRIETVLELERQLEL